MRLIIAGTGFPEILTLVNEINKIKNNSIEVVGFIDDNKQNSNRNLYGYSYLGPFEELRNFKDTYVINTVSRSMKIRYESTKRLIELGANFCNLIHPLSTISINNIGLGNIVLAGCVFEIGTTVGSHNLFLRNNIVGHDSKIFDYSFFGHGCIINGHTFIDNYCFIGANSTLGPSIKVAQKTVISPGSYIGTDTKEKSSYMSRPPQRMYPIPKTSDHFWGDS